MNLERQKELLKNQYPNYKLIPDIGSGMNLNRRGLRQIIDNAIKGEVDEVVIVHKDKLCHFGYELIEDLIKKIF
jgi:putative resolvase